jgi:lipoate-protein ligase A
MKRFQRGFKEGTLIFLPSLKTLCPLITKSQRRCRPRKRTEQEQPSKRRYFLGDATIDGKTVSYETAFERLVEWLRSAKKPTVVVGPLLLWDWQEEGLSQKAKALRGTYR